MALLLTHWPSVTGTVDEAALPAKLAASLTFDSVWVAPIPGDVAGRSNVFALKRGMSQRTIVLTGHFDVVSVEDYGPLQDLAFKPEQLLLATLNRLRMTGENPLALSDFESGDYHFSLLPIL